MTALVARFLRQKSQTTNVEDGEPVTFDPPEVKERGEGFGLSFLFLAALLRTTLLLRDLSSFCCCRGNGSVAQT